jgi:mono/diheme cytochrome c family protein
MRLRAEIAALAAAVVLIAAGLLAYQWISDRSERRDRAIALTRGDPDRAPEHLRRFGCAGCHTISGLPGANGLVGPPLQSLVKRVYVGSVRNTPGNLVAWIVNPRALNPNTPMPVTGISEDAARDVAAFLYTH